jgi:hypothetical protein
VLAAAGLGALRGLAVVAFVALFGFGIAGLARVTGAALGAAFVYFVIVESLVRGLVPGWARYLLSTNIAAVLLKHVAVEAGKAHFGVTRMITIGGRRGAVTLVVYAVLIVGAFYATFERRDVT